LKKKKILKEEELTYKRTSSFLKEFLKIKEVFKREELN
jgi:hypothetical protein